MGRMLCSSQAKPPCHTQEAVCSSRVKEQNPPLLDPNRSSSKGYSVWLAYGTSTRNLLAVLTQQPRPCHKQSRSLALEVLRQTLPRAELFWNLFSCLPDRHVFGACLSAKGVCTNPRSHPNSYHKPQPYADVQSLPWDCQEEVNLFHPHGGRSVPLSSWDLVEALCAFCLCFGLSELSHTSHLPRGLWLQVARRWRLLPLITLMVLCSATCHGSRRDAGSLARRHPSLLQMAFHTAFVDCPSRRGPEKWREGNAYAYLQDSPQRLQLWRVSKGIQVVWTVAKLCLS